MAKLRRLAPGRSAPIGGLVDRAGQVLTDKTEMAAELRRHWSGVFGPRRHQPAQLKRWLQEELEGQQALQWDLRREDPQKAIAEAPSTSPGPDGMPPRAWQALGPLGEQVLWDALQMVSDPLQQEEAQRDWPNMNESTMVFLPKLDPGVNGAAGDTRPLNISNGENRVMANAVRYGFERAMKDWVSEMQQGFLPNRSMLKNVVDIDHKMQMDSLTGEEGGNIL